MARILIIDDEPAMVDVISTLCRELDHEVFPFNSAARAIEALPTCLPQVVVADIKMESVSGFDVLRACHDMAPRPAVVMVTGYASVETAVEAMKLGAYDYVTKPFKIDDLQLTIQRALDFQCAVRENVYLKKELKDRYKFENIIGTSAKMQQVYDLVAKVADTDSTILIQGESGTGKELVARALHFNSRRQHHPFVAINCSALPENLLESELFGHKKGAFTGAVQDKLGLFEEAHDGTIFLDEINSMAQTLQTKLLRVLQERVIRHVGDTKSIPINVRVLAATNESLHEKISTGGFREDLYYRLAVIPIEMPPLRDRLEDIPLLAHHFIQKIAVQNRTPVAKIEQDAVEALGGYSWPGNVRELENAIERACALCEQSVIRLEDLPTQVTRRVSAPAGATPDKLPIGEPLDAFVKDLERQFIEETIRFNGGSRERAAKMLGISMATLYRKIAN